MVLSMRRRGRRDRGEIVIDVLRAALDGEVKTRIMFKSNLYYRTFNYIFSELLDKGFIVRCNGFNGKFLYKTSERGKKALEAGMKFYNLINTSERN